jgi:hypothetical protein
MSKTDDIKEEAREQHKDSVMSKAGRLAMELSAEKKRLRQEMEELTAQVEDLSPTTPTGTVDSYVKWIATVFGVFGIFLQQADHLTTGQVFYVISAFSWIYVGSSWNDKAIIIGSTISATAVLMTLVRMVV